MRKNILFVVFAVLNLLGFAQSLQLIDSHNHNITNGDTLLTLGNDTLDEIKTEIKVKNTGSTDIYIKVKRENNAIVPYTENYLCWFDCYLPSNLAVFAPIDSVLISPGAICNNFSSDYKPNFHSGISLIKYIFYSQNPSVSAVVYVKYDITATAVSSISANSTYISNPFPVPANTSANFNYSLKSMSRGYVAIYNILGEEVKRTTILSSGTVKINTSDLKQGVYIYSFVVDDKIVKSNSIIVNH